MPTIFGFALVLAVVSCGSNLMGPDGGGTAGTTGSAGTTGAGGSGNVGTTSGVLGSRRLDALTTADKQAICDWVAAHFGGYGHVIDCGGGTTLEAEASQASCVASAPTSCPVTVSEYEACVNAVSCANLFPPACESILSCS